MTTNMKYFFGNISVTIDYMDNLKLSFSLKPFKLDYYLSIIYIFYELKISFYGELLCMDT